MLLGHQDFGKLADAIGKKLAVDPAKYRQIARETEPFFGCAGDYSSEAPPISQAGAYGRALNRMHFAAGGSGPAGEGSKRNGLGEAGTSCEEPNRHSDPLGPCAQVCIDPLGFSCGPEPFYCEGQTRYICNIFTCNPGLHGGNTCFQEFECAVRFRCTSFDDSGEDCAWSTTFTCSPSAYTP